MIFARANEALNIEDLTELVLLAKAGDSESFENVVRATYLDAYALAYRLTQNIDDACDVTQEAYFRAYKSLKNFRGDSTFPTWLYRIVANCASTHLTRKGKRRHYELDGQIIIDEDNEYNPEVKTANSFEWDRITDALAELPPRLRAVVVLKDIYDFSHKAIANELGITEAATKVRLHRARKKLREVLFPLRFRGGDDKTV